MMNYDEAAACDSRDSDTKNLEQRLIGISEHAEHMHARLSLVADNFYGSRPEPVSPKAERPAHQHGLGKLNDMLDQIQERLKRLDDTVSRFSNLV